MRPTDVPDTGLYKIYSLFEILIAAYITTFNFAVYQQVCYATCCGQIQTRMCKDGVRTTVEFLLHSVQTLSANFSIDMTWISFVELTRYPTYYCSMCFLGLITFLKNNYYFQVVEDGYEFFAKRQLVTLFSAPNYCGEFDNAGGMMSVDETLMCSFQVYKPYI